MKIAFIHACLEPGRDGVGDYTAGLAAECARQNVACRAVGLRDPFVTRAWEGDREGVACLRLPQSRPWRERIEAAGRFLDREEPDWISLQYVPYAYDPRGLIFGLGRRLAPLFRRRRAHIMFHELWIGRETGDPLKERVVGWMQRRLAVRLALNFPFHALHTSNAYYQSHLERAGVAAGLLPLFGAIAPVENPSTGWIDELAGAAGWPLTPATRGQFLLFGLFGSIHPVWPPEPLFGLLAEAGARLGRKIGVLSIGRQGPGAAHWEQMAAAYAGRLHFLRLGEQPEGRVSAFFQFIDYGLATTPYALIGKSASVAAMTEHGLPVIVNRDEIPFKGEAAGPGERGGLLLRMGRDLPEVLAAGVPREKPARRLPGVAAKFARELEEKLVKTGAELC